jgi:hypothetical protein
MPVVHLAPPQTTDWRQIMVRQAEDVAGNVRVPMLNVESST